MLVFDIIRSRLAGAPETRVRPSTPVPSGPLIRFKHWLEIGKGGAATPA